MDNAKVKELVNKRFNSLVQEYKNWQSAHKDLSTYLNPTRGQFSVNSTRGTMIDHQILLDDHATHDIRILASGMQSGMTSPARPWFRLNIGDKTLNKLPNVRMWLDDTAERIFDVCANSNVYDVFFSIYEELGQFGTGCAIILEDYDKVVRLRNFTAGEYFIACDSRGIVNTFGREFILTVNQCVDMFGVDNCSMTVQGYYKNNQMDVKVTVRHIIEPNDKADQNYIDNMNMPFRSLYWETGTDDNKFLDTTGFFEFPIIAPRWDTVTTSTVYGYGPGWFALGNVKQLQKTVLDKLLAQEKIHNPPMQEDSSVEGHSNYLPGGKTKVSSSAPNTGVRPAYQIDAQIQSFIESINGLKEAIDKSFYTNVFLMLINLDKSNMTATEVARREQENIMMMGPLLNRVNSEMLSVFLERLYGIMERNMMFLPAPEEIADMSIKIEFVSILAQAQKAVGAVSIDRTVERIGGMAGLNPAVIDVFNFDEAVREYADMEGVPANLIVDPKVVKQIREQRAQAQQMQTNLALANQGADTAQKLSNAKTSEESALTGVMSMVPGMNK